MHTDLYKRCCHPPFHLSSSHTLKPTFFVAWLFLPLSPKPAVLLLDDFSTFRSFT